jgi:hypothetical protein
LKTRVSSVSLFLPRKIFVSSAPLLLSPSRREASESAPFVAPGPSDAPRVESVEGVSSTHASASSSVTRESARSSSTVSFSQKDEDRRVSSFEPKAVGAPFGAGFGSVASRRASFLILRRKNAL